ncbi:FKBP-type peptidyl-prolyl cis-trans isomerase [Fodinicola acaciae]|uniref:FKBP-type peptidyl-prolyl cis-trans isomerase n=1 Tax=Fodinicola acaciae TaxID=2681555 RepID=UPI0013D2310C|nr:FKBP-type peptidyl-prolyl cis-trans isomerase [Fodinicola acaciae]
MMVGLPVLVIVGSLACGVVPAGAGEISYAQGIATYAGTFGRPCHTRDVRVSGAVATPPTIDIPRYCSAPLALLTRDLAKGIGPAAMAGSSVTVNYVLVTWSDGRVADSSWPDKPFVVDHLGGGEVIAGWDQGLVGVRPGTRRLLVIPPELAYGSKGVPPVVKPNETLVFVVDVIAVS